LRAIRFGVWSGHDDLAPPDLASERRALLDDQGVGADVIGLEGDGLIEAGPPVVHRLPRRAVDQVDADLLETGLASPLHGLRDAGGVVRALEGRQHVRHRRLHPEADPGESGCSQVGE
jgi:hypothetical protein